MTDLANLFEQVVNVIASILLLGVAAFVVSVLGIALRKAFPSILRLIRLLGSLLGTLLEATVRVMIADAQHLVDVLVIGVAIVEILGGASNVFYGYRGDLPAYIPAILLVVSVGVWGLKRESLASLLAASTTAFILGLVVQVVDETFRSLLIVGSLATLIVVNQRQRNLYTSGGSQMFNPNEKHSTIMMKAMKVGLVVYTMARTIDLVMSTLPEGTIRLLGIFAVFGLDIALLIWDSYASDPLKARSDGQHYVALGMIVANLLGIGAALIADSARMLDPEASKSLILNISIYGIPAVILGNLMGMVAVNQLDPDREEAQRRMDHARRMTQLDSDHEREMALTNRKTELEVQKLQNDRRVIQKRDEFFMDTNGNGVRDLGEVAGTSYSDLAHQLQRQQPEFFDTPPTRQSSSEGVTGSIRRALGGLRPRVEAPIARSIPTETPVTIDRDQRRREIEAQYLEQLQALDSQGDSQGDAPKA